VKKCFVFVIFLAVFLGCNSREKENIKPQENEVLISDLNVGKIESIASKSNLEANDGGNAISTLRDIDFYEQRGLGNLYDPERNSYELRNPHIDELLTLQNIHSLSIGNDYNVGKPSWSRIDFPFDLSFLENFSQLRDLSIGENVTIENLDFFRYLQNLEFLYIPGYKTLDFSPISNLINLRSVEVSGNEIINAEAILELPNLESAWLWSLSEITINFMDAPLSSKLEVLSLSSPTIDVSNIGMLPNLNSLRIVSSDIAGFANWENPRLESLHIIGLQSSLGDRLSSHRVSLKLDEMVNLYLLNYLFIEVFDIEDVSPLLELPNLVSVRFNSSYVDIMPLLESKTIRSITVDSLVLGEFEILRDLFAERGIIIEFEDRS